MVPNPDLAPLVGNSKHADRSKQHPRRSALLTDHIMTGGCATIILGRRQGLIRGASGSSDAGLKRNSRNSDEHERSRSLSVDVEVAIENRIEKTLYFGNRPENNQNVQNGGAVGCR
jgi:hypothetical protein